MFWRRLICGHECSFCCKHTVSISFTMLQRFSKTCRCLWRWLSNVRQTFWSTFWYLVLEWVFFKPCPIEIKIGVAAPTIGLTSTCSFFFILHAFHSWRICCKFELTGQWGLGWPSSWPLCWSSCQEQFFKASSSTWALPPWQATI